MTRHTLSIWRLSCSHHSAMRQCPESESPCDLDRLRYQAVFAGVAHADSEHMANSSSHPDAMIALRRRIAQAYLALRSSIQTRPVAPSSISLPFMPAVAKSCQLCC